MAAASNRRAKGANVLNEIKKHVLEHSNKSKNPVSPQTVRKQSPPLSLPMAMAKKSPPPPLPMITSVSNQQRDNIINTNDGGTVHWIDQQTLLECDRQFQEFTQRERTRRWATRTDRRQVMARMRREFKCFCQQKASLVHLTGDETQESIIEKLQQQRRQRTVCAHCFAQFDGDYAAMPFVVCDHCVYGHKKYFHEKSYMDDNTNNNDDSDNDDDDDDIEGEKNKK